MIFILWNSARTLPYLPIYGLDAARDAVIWGYAIFSFILLLVLPPLAYKNFIHFLRNAILLWLGWGIAGFVITHYFQFNPLLQSFQKGLFLIRVADYGMPLAGIAIFLSLRMDVDINQKFQPQTLLLLWGLWLINFLIAATDSRAALLSSGIGLLPLLIFYPKKVGRLLQLIWVLLLLVFIFILASFSGQDSINAQGFKREISIQQLQQNILSIIPTLGKDSVGNAILVQNRDWRLAWWSDIVTKISQPEYFIQGQGYGINLALDYKRTTASRTDPLRSPHNVFMTFLARSGYPGLFLWFLLLIMIFYRLGSSFLLLPPTSPKARILIFYFFFILSYLINASFGVVIEGPMGGIWFWGLIGLGLGYAYSIQSPSPYKPELERIR